MSRVAFPWVTQLVSSLTRLERYVVMLTYAEELTPAEVGLVLEIPESTVSAILDRLRATVASRVDQHA